MESDFLKSLHEVRRMSAEMGALMARMEGSDTPAAKKAYAPVAEGVAGLLKEARQLRRSYEKANKVGGPGWGCALGLCLYGTNMVPIWLIIQTYGGGYVCTIVWFKPSLG